MIARKREVLAEGMAFEPIIGEDAPKVRVAGKKHPVHVEYFALQPSRIRPQRRDSRNRSIFRSRTLHHDPAIRRQGKQHVDHFEPFGTARVINTCDLHQLLILVLVAQHAKHVFDTVTLHGEQQLTMFLMGAEQMIAQRLAERTLQPVDHGKAGRGM